MNEKHYAQMFAALDRIRSYQSPERMKKHSARDWGLDDPHEAIEYAYENVLQEAKNGLRGVTMTEAELLAGLQDFGLNVFNDTQDHFLVSPGADAEPFTEEPSREGKLDRPNREFDSPDRGQAEREDILKILQREIRLVVKPESKNWMVKPGCLEKCAEQITAIRNLQPPASVEATGAGREQAPDDDRMWKIDSLIADLQKVSKQFGNTCVYIRRHGISWGAVALNYRDDDKKNGLFDVHAEHDRRLVQHHEQVERLIASRDEWMERADRAEKELASLRTTPAPSVSDEEYGYAKRLACHLWEQHWKVDAPEWKPLPDLLGVLTQLDNMVAGLVKPAPSVDSGNVQGWRPPLSLHWLGDLVRADAVGHAKDECGCVMYFATEAECNLFMEWMTARSAAVYCTPPKNSGSLNQTRTTHE